VDWIWIDPRKDRGASNRQIKKKINRTKRREAMERGKDVMKKKNSRGRTERVEIAVEGRRKDRCKSGAVKNECRENREAVGGRETGRGRTQRAK
jgi:hypothetical protein